MHSAHPPPPTPPHHNHDLRHPSATPRLADFCSPYTLSCTFMHFMHPSPNPRSSSVCYTKTAVVSRISAAGAQWYRTRPSLVHSSPPSAAYTRSAICRPSWAFAVTQATPAQLFAHRSALQARNGSYSPQLIQPSPPTLDQLSAGLARPLERTSLD